MSKLINQYCAGRISRREISRSTGNRQRSVLRSFARSFGERHPKNLSRTDIEQWIATRSHLAPGTRRYEIATMRSFVKWLQLERITRRDPMIAIKNPKVPRRVPRALSPDQDAALEAVLPDARARAIYALMRWGGLRRCEVIRVEIGDWDRQQSVLHITGKGDNQRNVPVTTKAARWLDEYISQTGSNAGPLIRRKDGHGGISNCYLGMLMRTWMELADVKHHPRDGKACHSLRHTLASNVADIEHDLRVVQELLGHASLTSTQLYLRNATQNQLRQAMEAAA